jgi:hypothetical protein
VLPQAAAKPAGVGLVQKLSHAFAK